MIATRSAGGDAAPSRLAGLLLRTWVTGASFLCPCRGATPCFLPPCAETSTTFFCVDLFPDTDFSASIKTLLFAVTGDQRPESPAMPNEFHAAPGSSLCANALPIARIPRDNAAINPSSFDDRHASWASTPPLSAGPCRCAGLVRLHCLGTSGLDAGRRWLAAGYRRDTAT